MMGEKDTKVLSKELPSANHSWTSITYSKHLTSIRPARALHPWHEMAIVELHMRQTRVSQQLSYKKLATGTFAKQEHGRLLKFYSTMHTLPKKYASYYHLGGERLWGSCEVHGVCFQTYTFPLPSVDDQKRQLQSQEFESRRCSWWYTFLHDSSDYGIIWITL